MGTLTHHASPTRLGRPLLILSLAFALITLISQSPVLGQPTLAATRKLSAITATTGEVKDALIAGNYIIYLANYDAEERYDLYSASLGGGVVTRLTADLPAAAIGTFAVTPAGRVVFAARQTATGLRYMYSIPAAGGQLTLLGPTYPAVRPPLISSQLVFGLAGERVIFAVDAQVANGFELYSVPAAGGPSIRLSPELPPTSGSTFPAPYWVTYFAIDDGAGQHVAFNVYQGPAPQGAGLYTVPADGSVPPTRISDALAPQLSDKLDLTPDGQRVVYTRGTELRTVRFTGGDDTLIDTGSGIPFAVTPDSARVVYARSGDYPAGATIHSFPFTSAVSTTVASGVQYAAAQTFQLTPGGPGVLYNDKDATALLLAPVTGGITQTVIAEPVGPTGVQFTGDGARAIFQTWSGTPAIYSYPLAGGSALRIDDPGASDGGFLSLEAIADGRALYAARNAASGDAFRLYSVPAAGGASTPLTGDLGTGQELIAVRATAGSNVVFTSGTRLSGPTRWPWLYAVPADGSAAARLVDTPRAIVGDVTDFAVSPADGRAVYLADQERDGVLELYSVPLAGGAPTKLNLAGQQVADFRVSPVGGRVVYLAGAGGSAPGTLYSVSMGGGAATAFSPDLSGMRADFKFTSDGAAVVFGGDTSRDPFSSPVASPLYSAPVAGGQAVVIAQSVTRFELDPGGARVVFVVGMGTGGPIEVRAAPVTGGGSVALGATSTENALTGPLLFTRDGTRVIFQTGGFMGTGAIVSLPPTGGEPTTLVSATELLENATLQLNADSSAVLYGGQLPRSDPGLPFTFRMQRILVTGGPPTTLAEPTLPANSSMPQLRFVQAPGGGPVVFRLSRSGTSSIEQFIASVPETGGSLVTLYGLGPAADASTPFVVSADGSQILFAGADGLYRAPAAGGSPEQIKAGTVFGGFSFAEDGSALFVEGGTRVYSWPSGGQVVGGKLFHGPLGGPAVQLFDLPVGMAGTRFVQAGQSVVFPAVAGAVGTDPASGTTELYAADIALAPPAGGFTATEAKVAEGAGPAGIEVRLSYTPSVTTTVSFSATGGTAVAGLDYTLGAGPLAFAPGETVKTLPLTILDRPRFNGSRTLVITLGAPTLAAAPARPTTITITIVDDEVGLFLPLARR